MTDTARDVMDASELTSLEPLRKSGFTEEERNEIVYRLQAVENLCETLSFQLNDVIGELFPIGDAPEGEVPRKVNMVREIHGFCVRLSAVLDAMSSNPMIAAMMPPGAFSE